MRNKKVDDMSIGDCNTYLASLFRGILNSEEKKLEFARTSGVGLDAVTAVRDGNASTLCRRTLIKMVGHIEGLRREVLDVTMQVIVKLTPSGFQTRQQPQGESLPA
jgi:hypothetical protein